MTKLPSVKADRLIRALGRAGFVVHRTTGGHYFLKHPLKPRLLVVVPHHSGDIKRPVLRSILRQAELTIELLQELL
jgi:predicted RNA binding protein YcfA (HicA-like mRNA interferase family)